MPTGKLWTQRDRSGNEIYLTVERWAHIIDPDNHPEVELFFDEVAETIKSGRRRQDPYDPIATNIIVLFQTYLTTIPTW